MSLYEQNYMLASDIKKLCEKEYGLELFEPRPSFIPDDIINHYNGSGYVPIKYEPMKNILLLMYLPEVKTLESHYPNVHIETKPTTIYYYMKYYQKYYGVHRSLRDIPAKMLFDFVVKELQESLLLLSTAHSNSPGDYYGRITRPVVYFLLAKLALNAEVFTDNDWTDGLRPNGREIYFRVGERKLNAWQTVLANCDSITDLNYSLSLNYADNFSVFNESSGENIFTIPMDKNLYTNQMQYLFRSRHYNHAKAYGLGGENGSCATIEALRVFAYGTDSVDTRFYENYYADTMFDLNGDTIRLDNGTPLVYLPLEVRLDLSRLPAEKTAGARMKKYEIDKMGTKDGKLSDNDIVLFRYADVLLMRSEAKVRNGENGDEELNAVRFRVGMLSRKATLENILAERQLELAWEGWRRQDLVRFGKFTRPYTDRPQLPHESNGYTTVFPIPDKVRSLNPNLTQNPGY